MLAIATQEEASCHPNLPRRRSTVSGLLLQVSNGWHESCATEEPFVQRAEFSHIVNDVSGGPSPQTEPTHVDDCGIHTGDMAENGGLLENGKHSTTKHSTPLVQNISSHMNAPALLYKDPSPLPVLEAPPPVQTSTESGTPLLLTYEPSTENASAQEIVKAPTNEDDKKKLAIVESIKVLPSVGAFTVQCALCMKWRLIPTKEQYEEIRQSVLEKPFFCNSAASWRPDVSCEDPSDVLQDESHLWAIDRPNIPVAPPGWERQIVIRAAGASKFADVYYVAPSGRKLRSMPEVERFLAEFPEYVRAGVKYSQFSFIIPRPLDSNYCRKKTAGLSSLNASSGDKSQSKQPQVKKSIKRKTFESLLSKEDDDELDGRKKWSGGGLVAENSEKGLGMPTSYNGSISQQVVKGSLPPEELMKGLFWSRPSNPEHASSSGTLEPPSTVGQSEALLKENL
ncbi:hypothetical protein GOP47_0007506 [Adiantum capillus-veneris]|uniref:Uncharacterized protein n=1 Tax=Adiantum capillus-veneris TaxID=13818 RepID=A0A9D4V2A5_ADICA|nr:hypothetical protein GOP47_0007506 [Adiantum capillus-veneris]